MMTTIPAIYLHLERAPQPGTRRPQSRRVYYPAPPVRRFLIMLLAKPQEPAPTHELQFPLPFRLLLKVYFWHRFPAPVDQLHQQGRAASEQSAPER